MHREQSLKTTLWSGCLSVLGLVLYSTTSLAAEAEDADPPSAEAKTEKETVTLPEMTVTATPGRDTGYRAPNAAVTSKTDTPLFDSPFSLQVVPEQVFKDQRSTTIKDALENVSGVRSHSNDVEGYVYNIRGFQVLSVFRNSLLVTFAIPTVFETALRPPPPAPRSLRLLTLCIVRTRCFASGVLFVRQGKWSEKSVL